jgi:hypothetical protein
MGGGIKLQNQYPSDNCAIMLTPVVKAGKGRVEAAECSPS